MTPFVRFIVAILGVGVAVNLAILMGANARSIEEQAANRKNEMTTFGRILDDVSDTGRRAYFVVESQEMTGDGVVTRSTLLVRRPFQSGFNPAPSPEDQRMPLTRVSIGGDQLCIDGLVLEFGANFRVDVEGHEWLQGRKLSYFAHVYGADDTAADAENRFSFVHSPEIPELTRIHPEAETPTFFEMQLWLHIWDLVQNPQWARDADMKASYLEPAKIKLKNGHAYEAYLNASSVSIQEDTTPGRAATMIEDGKKLKEPKE